MYVNDYDRFTRSLTSQNWDKPNIEKLLKPSVQIAEIQTDAFSRDEANGELACLGRDASLNDTIQNVEVNFHR